MARVLARIALVMLALAGGLMSVVVAWSSNFGAERSPDEPGTKPPGIALVLALTFAPFAIGAALRISVTSQ